MNVNETKAFIAWANIIFKFIYNKHHRSLSLKVGNKAFVRLHKEYNLSLVKSLKLAIQRVDPFKILEKKSNLIYRLELPKDWRIYLVIFIANLEFALASIDPYNRLALDHPKLVKKFNENWHSYEIETLVNH